METEESEQPTVSPAAYPIIDPPPASLAASMDACLSKRYPADTTVVPTDSLRAHLAGAVRDFGRFSVFVPDRAKLTLTNGADGFAAEWPDCGFSCRFGVSIRPDSAGKGIEGIVAALVAEQRRIDSINKDSRTSVFEFDEIGAPPQPFTTESERGYEIDDACGDCAATRLLFGRNGFIGTVGGSADAVPGTARHICTMMAAAKTFRWRD